MCATVRASSRDPTLDAGIVDAAPDRGVHRSGDAGADGASDAGCKCPTRSATSEYCDITAGPGYSNYSCIPLPDGCVLSMAATTCGAGPLGLGDESCGVLVVSEYQ